MYIALILAAIFLALAWAFYHYHWLHLLVGSQTLLTASPEEREQLKHFARLFSWLLFAIACFFIILYVLALTAPVMATLWALLGLVGLGMIILGTIIGLIVYYFKTR